MTAKKKKKGGGIFWKLLFLVALCVFCFSMYQLVNIYLGYKKGVDEYHAVAEATTGSEGGGLLINAAKAALSLFSKLFVTMQPRERSCCPAGVMWQRPRRGASTIPAFFR